MRHDRRSYLVTALLLFFSLCFLLAILSIGATPPFSRDALIHHLYIPKLWLQTGSIAPIPDLSFSYYPMNLDLLYLIPLYFDHDFLAKYIHFSFALLTGWLIFRYLRRRLDTPWALFGTLFFLSLPIIVKLSATVYVDLGLIAFTTASLLLLLRWAEEHRTRYLVLAGICCGLAAGTKYNGLISIFLLTAFTPLIHIRLGELTGRFVSLRAAGWGLLFLLISLLTFSPWMLRNYRLTGNPIYPLYESYFTKTESKASDNTVNNEDGPSYSQSAQSMLLRSGSHFSQRKYLYQETWWQALMLPVRFFFEGRDGDPRYFDGKLNPFLLVFMFLAFYHHRYSDRVRTERWFLLAFGWLFFFFTFFQEALRIRYIAAALPMFAILATFGLHNVHARLRAIPILNKKMAATLLIILAAPPLVYNTFYLWQQFRYYKTLDYITGNISRDDYLAHYLPDYPVQRFAAENLSPSSRILAVLVGRRGYYFEHPVTFDPNGASRPLWESIRSASSPDDIYRRLTDKGFSHLLIRFDLFNKSAGADFTVTEINRFNNFLDEHAEQLAANEGSGLSFVLFALHE